MARIYIINGYRGKDITHEAYWPKGERDVTDDQAAYLVARGHAQYVGRANTLQSFVGQDASIAVSIDNVFSALESKTDSQLKELGALNGLTIPDTATREQAIRALVTAAVRPGANLVLTAAPRGAVLNNLLPRTEEERRYVDLTGVRQLPSEEERNRLALRGHQALTDLEYSALSTEQKLEYERARGTNEVNGVDVDLARMTKAQLIDYGADRSIALDDSMTKADMISALQGK